MTVIPDIVWPETLPQSPLLDGWQETLADNVLRTAMEQGPPKLRRRGSAGSGKMTVHFLLSRDDCALVDDFYQTALAGGIRPFTFTHPRRVQAVACRFAAPPDYTAAGDGFFRVRLSLEILAGETA